MLRVESLGPRFESSGAQGPVLRVASLEFSVESSGLEGMYECRLSVLSARLHNRIYSSARVARGPTPTTLTILN